MTENEAAKTRELEAQIRSIDGAAAWKARCERDGSKAIVTAMSEAC